MLRSIVVLVALTGGAWGVGRLHGEAHAAPKADPAGDRVVPVVAAPVLQRDVPVFIDGLGSVVAFNTITVKPQVDGRLDRVAFREGQDVKKGDLLAQIDPRPFEAALHQAEGAMARDAATLKGNKVSLDRNVQLKGAGLASQQNVDDATSAYEQFQGVVRLDQAAIETARVNLDYTHITSPIDGVTGVRLVDAGNIVHQTDTAGLVIITQLDPIAVLFTLPEDDLPRLSKQLAAGPVAVDAYGRDGETKLASGTIALIDNQINQTTATIRVKAVFPNPSRVLWPNQFVKARVLLTTQKGALTVPAAVVQRGPQGTFAYVIGADQKAAVRPITVDRIQGEIAIITDGLKPGEQVVADGQYQLKPGSKVSTKDDKAGAGAPAGSGKADSKPAAAGSGAPR